jgi:hypothetical protein
VSFLRRILGPKRSTERARPSESAKAPDAEGASTAAELEAEERRRDLEMLRQEQARLDELQQRQLRYADRAWTPPAQGGERRADDEVDTES